MKSQYEIERMLVVNGCNLSANRLIQQRKSLNNEDFERRTSFNMFSTINKTENNDQEHNLTSMSLKDFWNPLIRRNNMLKESLSNLNKYHTEMVKDYKQQISELRDKIQISKVSHESMISSIMSHYKDENQNIWNYNENDDILEVKRQQALNNQKKREEEAKIKQLKYNEKMRQLQELKDKLKFNQTYIEMCSRDNLSTKNTKQDEMILEQLEHQKLIIEDPSPVSKSFDSMMIYKKLQDAQKQLKINELKSKLEDQLNINW